MKYVLRLTQQSSILLFALLAISLGLNRPSSGQYLQKLKNTVAYPITRQFYGIPFTFVLSLVLFKPSKDEAQPALFKDPVRTAL